MTTSSYMRPGYALVWLFASALVFMASFSATSPPPNNFNTSRLPPPSQEASSGR